MSGFEGDLNPSQQAALDEFRENVKGKIPTERVSNDHYLLRWLRARDFNVSKAEEMICKSMIYRKEMKLDTIMDDFNVPEVIQTYQAANIIGFTKTGAPLMVMRNGIIDRKGIYLSVRRQEMTKYCLRLVEKCNSLMEEKSKETGRNVKGMVFIQDFEGFGLKNMHRPSITFFAQMTKIYDENYPELMDAVYIVNAPKIFYVIYAAIKPFLNERTRQKVHIFAGNYESKLVEAVGSKYLPKFLGGELVDENGDPYCSALIGKGGDVPKSYYLANTDCDQSLDKYSTVHVGARDTLSMDFDIDTPGTEICWEFKTDNHNIAFGIYKSISSNNGNTEKLDVVTLLRRDSHLYTEIGSYCCEDPGQYTVVFDNTFSWINSKTLRYLIEIKPPGSENF
ncbi:uncharacterized protein TRIADDRAFT_60313 [Trichoplax adhaerens]|uniref:CRAL-TRIO domain-containing protein n=1 Tax=Trichoplax adhaerens TaxID=10228 RepID=B3S7V9_TRIAD|nr:hypothetical protein TRIADDRAFT_60313 [Trichoplax adhaerens]EDV21362.1 hypothetical protein TRIADDRAFT_60313 [Trichoplax adhaerens]|eukprot:XP_002116329.1 hypothetical protein TRIADDRAFT_60313 [Trichoplax adhaerens]